MERWKYMMKIHGIPVELINKNATSIDPFGREIVEDVIIVVENVLVGEPSTDDINNSLDLYGKKLAYTLAIPKGDTNDWEDAEVIFFGQRFRTFGNVTQGIEQNIPLAWNKKVKVERYE